MSHFTTVKTKLIDLECIRLACKDLGFKFTESKDLVTVRGWGNSTRKARASIQATNRYDVGLQETKEGYALVADWYGIKNKSKFINNLTQRYSYHKVLKEIKNKGFTLEEEEIEDEEIQLTVRRWAYD